MTTAPQVAALLERSIDVGLLREPPDDPGLAAEVVLSEEFVVVLPVGHVLAGPAGGSCRGSGGGAVRAAEPRRGADGSRSDRGSVPVGGVRAAHRAVRGGVGDRLWRWSRRGSGVPPPASVRRIRLKGVAYRRIEPDSARTTVAMCWRRDDADPLVARFLEVGGAWIPPAPSDPARRRRPLADRALG